MTHNQDIERVASEVFKAMKWAVINSDYGVNVRNLQWVDGGNSLVQDEARRAARAAMPGVKVKPLDFTNDRPELYGYPDTALDQFGGHYQRWYVDGKQYFKHSSERYGQEGNPDDDNRDRILSAIEGATQ